MTRIGSLCSGYDGLSLALPGEPVWFAENNPDMSRLLDKRYPDVPNCGSVRPWVTDWARFERPDEIHAGFPCQPISGAGRQRHREDARYLWPDVARIVHVTRPRAVWLENVERIVSIDDGSVLHEVLDDLRLLGYFTRWTVIGACATGLAHHRHRWFAWAEWHGDYAPTPVRVTPPVKCGAPRGKFGPLLPSPMARDGDGRGEGDAAYWVKRRAEHARTNGAPLAAVLGLLFPTPRANERGTRETSPEVAVRITARTIRLDELATLPERFGEYATAIERHVSVTGTLPPAPTELNKNGAPRLSAAFAEWLMDLPAGWVTDGLDRKSALMGIGNGVVPRQARAAWEILNSA